MPEAVAEELCVKFRNIDEIQEFAKAVNQFDGDVDLKQGRITIDAKSLLGICSMNIEEEMELQVFNGDAEELKGFGAIYDFTKRMVADPARGLHGGLKILPHGLLKTWGEPCGARVKRRCGVMTTAPYDLFIDLKHSTNLRTTAKELDVPERRFVRFLIERRFVYRTASGNVLPYANVKNAGLFCVKDYCNHGHTGSYTLVTPQGKLYFAQLREMILLVL